MESMFAGSRFYLINIFEPHPTLLHLDCDLPGLKVTFSSPSYYKNLFVERFSSFSCL